MIPIIGPLLLGKLGKLGGNIAQIIIVIAALWALLAIHDSNIRAQRDQFWKLEIQTQTAAINAKLIKAQREALAGKVARDIADKARKEGLENEIEQALDDGRDPLDAVFTSMRANP